MLKHHAMMTRRSAQHPARYFESLYQFLRLTDCRVYAHGHVLTKHENESVRESDRVYQRQAFINCTFTACTLVLRETVYHWSVARLSDQTGMSTGC